MKKGVEGEKTNSRNPSAHCFTTPLGLTPTSREYNFLCMAHGPPLKFLTTSLLQNDGQHSYTGLHMRDYCQVTRNTQQFELTN